MSDHEEYLPANLCGRKPDCGCLVSVTAQRSDRSDAKQLGQFVAQCVREGLIVGTCTDDEVRETFGCKCQAIQKELL